MEPRIERSRRSNSCITTLSFEPKMAMNRVVFWDVDTQIDFMLPNGKLYVTGAVDIIPVLKEITDFANVNGIHRCGSIDVHTLNDPEFKIFPPHCVIGTKGIHKIPETSPKTSCMISKHTYDVFSEVDIMHDIVQTFKSEGIDTVIVYGVAVDYCVKTAALGFMYRGFNTILITDATAGVAVGTTRAAFNEMMSAGVKFNTFNEIKKMLS